MKETKTAYAYLIEHMQDPSFSKVWNVAYDFISKLPGDLCDELHESLNRGVDVLDSEPLLQMYIYSFGKMHNAKLQYAFNQLKDRIMNEDNIEIVDYGCGQGLATICYHDFIKKNGFKQNVSRITLIEPSSLALSRAELLISCFYPKAEIIAINKSFDELSSSDFAESLDKPIVHLFSNVIDIESYNLNHLVQVLRGLPSKRNEYIIVSPIQNSTKTQRLKNFASNLGAFIYYEKFLNKRQLDETRDWTCAVLLASSLSYKEQILTDIDKVFNEACALKEKKDVNPRSEYFEKMFYKLQVCAESGDMRCQNQLGIWYEEGLGTKQNIQKAIEWYEKSANQGYVSACCNLALIYVKGEGVEINFTKGVHYFRIGAKEGDPHCQYNLGIAYLTGKGIERDLKAAYSLFKKSSKGYVPSKYMLFKCLYQGLGTSKDEVKAIKYLKEAARKNHPKSCYILGNLFLSGKYVEKDEGKAFRQYKKSAELGYSRAQEKLGEIFRNGLLGKEKSPKKSFNWYSKAAEQGNDTAQFYIGYFYDEGYGVKKDEKLSFEWYYKAAEQNNSAALNNLAVCYENGEGTVKDLQKAARFYEESAKLGSTMGKRNIARCYKEGIGVNIDPVKAKYWTLEAAKGGDVKSQGEIAWYYFKGYGTKRDLEESLIWYTRYYCKTNQIKNEDEAFKLLKIKAKEGDAQSLYIVGKCLQYGVVAKKDIKEAYSFFKQAAELNHIESLLKAYGASSLYKFCSSKDYKDTIKDDFGVTYSKDKKILISCGYQDCDVYKIASGVRIICNYAFQNSSIKKIIIPSSVLFMGDNPFIKNVWRNKNKVSIECHSPYFVILDDALYTRNMKKLVSYFGNASHFTIPKGVQVIGRSAFENKDLQEIDFPEELCSIEEYAFQYCTNLKRIRLPQNVNQLAKGCFYGCQSLSEIQSIGSVKTISKVAFMGCNIQKITFPACLLAIEDSAFKSNNNLHSIELPENLKSIGKESFAYCNIREITINDKLQEIGDFCFFKCPIIKLSIPSSLKTIGKNPFIGTKFVECKDNPKFVAKDGLLYDKESGVLISHFKEYEVALYPPICSVNSYAFYNSEVTDIFMGSNITEVAPWAFYNAQKLRKVIWRQSKITVIPEGCFGECLDIDNVDIPSSVNEVQKGSFFDCYNVRTIRICSINTMANEDMFMEIGIPNEIPNRYQPRGLMGSSINEYIEREVDFSTFPKIEIIVPKGGCNKYHFSAIYDKDFFKSKKMDRTFIVKEDDDK